MKNKLVIVTDANHVSVFHDKGNSDLALLDELEHPENRLKTSELLEDSVGHYRTDGSSHGAYTWHTSPKETVRNKFAIRVADLIQGCMDSSRCRDLVLIIEPTFYGLVKKHLSKTVENSISLLIKKNPCNLTPVNLKSFILDNRFAA